MSKQKATTVTVIFAIMLLAIDIGMYKLYPLGFFVLTGLLALYGFWKFSEAFFAWISEKPEEALEVPCVLHDDDLLPEDFTPTIESIMAEVAGQ